MKNYFFLPFLCLLCAFSFKSEVRPIPKTYSSQNPAFSFEYVGKLLPQVEGENPRIEFPLLERGTNLHEKYLEIVVKNGSSNCPDANNYPSDATPKAFIMNGKSFQKWENSDAGAGNIYDTEEYVIQKEGFCICFRFIFHSVRAENYDKPPRIFNKRKESNAIQEVLSSLKI